MHYIFSYGLWNLALILVNYNHVDCDIFKADDFECKSCLIGTLYYCVIETRSILIEKLKTVVLIAYTSESLDFFFS